MLVVYGGAFNPPTLAHFNIAKSLIDYFEPDLFYFLPVGDKYKKEDLVLFSHRFNMVEFLSNKLNAFVSNIENKEEVLGTYYTLSELSNVDKDIYFVIGADNLAKLSKWKNSEKLINEFKFIVLTREGYDVDLILNEQFFDFKNNFIEFDINIDISSSDYRKTKNSSILLDEVYQYIVENNLYLE